MKDLIPRLEAHLEDLRDELLERLKRAEEDSELLDWLDQQGDIGVVVIDPDLSVESQTFRWSAFGGVDVREAIRAARAKESDETRI